MYVVLAAILSVLPHDARSLDSLEFFLWQDYLTPETFTTVIYNATRRGFDEDEFKQRYSQGPQELPSLRAVEQPLRKDSKEVDPHDLNEEEALRQDNVNPDDDVNDENKPKKKKKKKKKKPSEPSITETTTEASTINTTTPVFEAATTKADFQTNWDQSKKYDARTYMGDKLNLYLCYLSQSTYRTGFREVRNYYGSRQQFLYTPEFEVGYLSQEIIARYQVVVELYQMVRNRHYVNVFANTVPVPFFFHVFTNILEQCQMITHLCRMLEVLPDKYLARYKQMVLKEKPLGEWEDYLILTTTTTEAAAEKNDTKTTTTTTTLPRFFDPEKVREEEIKRKRKLQRQRIKDLNDEKGMLARLRSTLSRSPKRYWVTGDTIYGWSIENW